MICKIFGGLFLITYGLECFGLFSLSPEISGVIALIAGIALLAGF